MTNNHANSMITRDGWTFVSDVCRCPFPSFMDRPLSVSVHLWLKLCAIESNDMTKIFLYSWRREHHFQPCLWICQKSQGPLMFQARLKLFLKHIYFHIFVLEKYTDDNFLLKFYFRKFLCPNRFSHTFECLGI